MSDQNIPNTWDRLTPKSGAIYTSHYVLKALLLTLLVSACSVQAKNGGWPGLPPDCWQKPREVHKDSHHQDLSEIVLLERAGPVEVKNKIYSPNGGYWMSYQHAQPDFMVMADAEKEALNKITFIDVHGVKAPIWINEKLIYMRVWWGRISATDFIFDVEEEKFIYSESLESGAIAMDQYKTSCIIHPGCKCIKAERQDKPAGSDGAAAD